MADGLIDAVLKMEGHFDNGIYSNSKKTEEKPAIIEVPDNIYSKPKSTISKFGATFIVDHENPEKSKYESRENARLDSLLNYKDISKVSKYKTDKDTAAGLLKIIGSLNQLIDENGKPVYIQKNKAGEDEINNNEYEKLLLNKDLTQTRLLYTFCENLTHIQIPGMPCDKQHHVGDFITLDNMSFNRSFDVTGKTIPNNEILIYMFKEVTAFLKESSTGNYKSTTLPGLFADALGALKENINDKQFEQIMTSVKEGNIKTLTAACSYHCERLQKEQKASPEKYYDSLVKGAFKDLKTYITNSITNKEQKPNFTRLEQLSREYLDINKDANTSDEEKEKKKKTYLSWF
ncbi:Uncharacterised protein [Candidatus Tiddalikarchaeum anstoanum]|nr:Uncharacterised protein [Candidatus Tiddalikarchaeum anstoanum]